MKQYLTLVAGMLLLLAGCGKETGPSGLKGEQPISFDVAAAGVQTRSPYEIDDAKLIGKSIGVFASYTGKLTYENTTVAPDYMYNQEVKHTSASVWEYLPVKYWPNAEDEYVSFFAYYPYEADPREGSSSGIIGMSRAVDYGDPWINFRLPDVDAQVDLMYGQQRKIVDGSYSFTPWLDQTRLGWGEAPLRFTMLHALACIGDWISVKMDDGLYDRMKGEVDITINNVSITYRNLTTKGRLVLRSSGSPNWKEIISGELTCSRTYNSPGLTGKVFSKDATSNPGMMMLVEDCGVFYIPMQVAGTERPAMDITVNYTVTREVGAQTGSFSDSATISVPFSIGDAGTKQGIALTLSAGFNLSADIVTDGVYLPGSLTPVPGF